MRLRLIATDLIAPVLIPLVLWLTSVVAQAEAQVDIAAWAARPGVRAVAVEFYATWCDACMKALPRWKALREKYGPEGLRVIVVNTRDRESNCARPSWQPDWTK